MKNPESLNDNILFMAGRITKRVHDAVTNAFREGGYDITVEQFSVLTSLWYEEGINQQTLAEQQDRDKTTIARIVNNMEKKGLVVRIPDRSDQRNKLIYLTVKGRELQEHLVILAGQVYIKALKSLDQDDLDAGIRLLTRITHNLK